MEIRELPIVGQVVALGGIVGDVILSGGDMILAGLLLLLETLDLWVPWLLTIERLAERLEWIPGGQLERIIPLALALLAGYRLFRIADKYADRLSNE